MRTNDTTASVKPSARLLLALAPRTMSRYRSTTCAWSMRPRTEYIATVAVASSANQSSHAPIDWPLWSESIGVSGSRRSHRRARGRGACGDETAVATLAADLGPVADPRLGNHDARRGGIDLDLSSEIGDVDAKILLRASELTAPHRIEDLLMCQCAPAGVHERAQDLPLDRCQMDDASIPLDTTRERVDGQTLKRHRRRGRWGRTRASQLRAGARRQLQYAERLRHIIVRASVQEQNFLILRMPCREHDDRRGEEAANFPTDVDA